MTNRLTASIALALALLAPAARADQLTLGTLPNPLTMNAGGPSPQMNVTVTNNTNSDPVANQMLGWQFTLTVQPDVGAVGAVTFNTPPVGAFSGVTRPA